MSSANLGNQLYQIVYMARAAMFDQGELSQLTYGAFDIAATSMQNMAQDEIEVTFPVGYNPDKTAIQSTRTYRKEELQEKYQFLAFHQLSINAIVQLVTITETMLGDIIRAVIARYPQKLGGKRNISIQAVLESTTLEEVHLRATDTLLNELAYKSPAEFSEAMNQLLSVNLLECPAFHRYMEIKATRDIFIHNQGVSNEVYIRKSGTHARARSGVKLPADIQYFLESYEQCLQITDWLEEELHNHWHSSDYEDRKTPQMEISLQEQETPLVVEQSE
ncbi:hypothetical protein [Halopseudomonas laoshanensis]|uniref:hypothetical protein n=1 Tax=Halopseudomonas laoshanensis TaxID=2268758 RepID=UPI0037357912